MARPSDCTPEWRVAELPAPVNVVRATSALEYFSSMTVNVTPSTILPSSIRISVHRTNNDDQKLAVPHYYSPLVTVKA
ncbi:hypothetical protein Hypma_011265 [Hypsizygus marmoreus]|uniref:Uncharacterized protein n=1 Tax=Hypsizygus marmoreus TaxID=39966 RepID=A0A369JK47_HYPMA|nr:hypothetical protein Hypma_011265 [Hypsizygus marmoreus]